MPRGRPQTDAAPGDVVRDRDGRDSIRAHRARRARGRADLLDAHAAASDGDFSDSAAAPAGDAGLDAAAVDSEPADQAGRAHPYEAGDRVPDFCRGLCDRALSADLRSDVPRREFSHLSAPAVHGVRLDPVVADSESGPGAAAALVPGADPLPVPADDSDDGGGGSDHARRPRDLSVVHRGRARMGPQADRRPGAGRADHVDRAGYLPDDRFHIYLLPVVAARGPRHAGSARVDGAGAAGGAGAYVTLAGCEPCALLVEQTRG